jgi:hypothetical protein
MRAGQRHRLVLAGLLAASLGFVANAAVGDETDSGEAPPTTGHFKVTDPSNLDADTASMIYDEMVGDMAASYALSQNPHAVQYRSWPRYNTAPYRATEHGDRYLNNYVNPDGAAYGKFEQAGVMPEGAVIAKDSFSVLESGRSFAGPLFLMEKLAPGASPETRNWRYTMIMPDGSVWGTTGGDNAEKVAFCPACHNAAEPDALFLLPEAYRARP